jgi:predicted NAD-dependent protein-ADP-ribosyltransferase YbiA (DUF1768 family)
MTININNKSGNWIEKILSNLYGSGFSLDGFYFRSIEGLLQGIGFPPEDPKRYRAFSLCGKEAERLSAQTKDEYVWLLDGKKVPHGSAEHYKLMERAIRAKFEQNPSLMRVLILTGNKSITCKSEYPENAKTPIQQEWFCRILMDIRAEAEKRNRTE